MHAKVAAIGKTPINKSAKTAPLCFSTAAPEWPGNPTVKFLRKPQDPNIT